MGGHKTVSQESSNLEKQPELVSASRDTERPKFSVATDFYLKEGGKVKVNWEQIAKIESDNLREEVLGTLFEMRILTALQKDCFMVTDGILNLGPSTGWSYGALFFTREEDADAFKAAKKAIYSIRVAKILG